MKITVKGNLATQIRGENETTHYIMFRVIKTYGEDNTTVLEEVWRGQ